MTRSSRIQIKEDEKSVLKILRLNSRENTDIIAEKCGFSRQKVWRIINRLENNKTIWGYSTVVDNEKIDLKEYMVLIKKTNEPLEKIADLIYSRDIEKKSEILGINIESSHYLHGHYDWIITFTAENLKLAKKFIELLNEIYRRYIAETVLIEKIFAVKKCNIQNPEIKQIKDFI